MSALFDNKKCVLCDVYVPQKPKILKAHVAMHVCRGEAHLAFVDGRQFVVITEKEKAAS